MGTEMALWGSLRHGLATLVRQAVETASGTAGREEAEDAVVRRHRAATCCRMSSQANCETEGEVA